MANLSTLGDKFAVIVKEADSRLQNPIKSWIGLPSAKKIPACYRKLQTLYNALLLFSMLIAPLDPSDTDTTSASASSEVLLLSNAGKLPKPSEIVDAMAMLHSGRGAAIGVVVTADDIKPIIKNIASIRTLLAETSPDMRATAWRMVMSRIKIDEKNASFFWEAVTILFLRYSVLALSDLEKEECKTDNGTNLPRMRALATNTTSKGKGILGIESYKTDAVAKSNELLKDLEATITIVDQTLAAAALESVSSMPAIPGAPVDLAKLRAKLEEARANPYKPALPVVAPAVSSAKRLTNAERAVLVEALGGAKVDEMYGAKGGARRRRRTKRKTRRARKTRRHH